MSTAPAIPDEFLADPTRYFTEWVPKAISERTDLAAKLGGTEAIAQISLEGDKGGTWHFNVKNGVVTVGNGAHEKPNFSVSMSVDSWRAMRTGALNPQMAFMQGKLKIKGDMGLAVKLGPLFR